MGLFAVLARCLLRSALSRFAYSAVSVTRLHLQNPILGLIWQWRKKPPLWAVCFVWKLAYVSRRAVFLYLPPPQLKGFSAALVAAA